MLEDLRRKHARLLEESVQKIVKMLSGRVEKISLFGSYARGRSDLFTDLDILIIMKTEKSFIDRLREIYSLLALPVDADILCYTPEEVERLKNKGFLKKGFWPRRWCSTRREAIDEGRRWLEQASEYLKWAKDLAERGGYHIACFLSQQVGEKALKAFLYAQGEEIVVGHSVERLCHQAARHNHKFEDMISVWAILDDFYIPTRYSNSVQDSIPAKVYTKYAASQAVEMANDIVELVKRKIGEFDQL